MKKLILSFGLLFCFSTYLLAGDGEVGNVEVSDFNALQQTSTPPTTPLHRRQKPETTFEVSNYLYKELEPTTPGGDDYKQAMKLTGIKCGLSRENLCRRYSYLPDPFFTDIQFRFMIGLLDYDGGKYALEDNGELSATPYKKIRESISYYIDFRPLVHYPIQVSNNINIELCPFSGLGIRHLGTLGWACGVRFSHYIYIPLGVAYKYQCKEGLLFDIRGEFDWMPLGLQFTGYLKSDDTAGLALNKQFSYKGYGLRLSGKVSKKFKNFEFSVSPFFRYWSIPQSDIIAVKRKFELGGKAIDCGLAEPKNYTRELGINLRISF